MGNDVAFLFFKTVNLVTTYSMKTNFIHGEQACTCKFNNEDDLTKISFSSSAV